MSYLVLARKWRPQSFEAITGQEHVTRTLTRAIEQDRVHHAFLFCGARGVGKTSAARVLARALNCEKGPTISPCGSCAPCVEIRASSSLDVFEIDGASNRGIGEIRELRERVAYAPQRDLYKIYIIDEVHMLTTEAFNALLKTLEEPPAHVKFIFATTEAHKIPVTILSRCQRFDFKRIPLAIMTERLGEILADEGVKIDPRGLGLVARESEGSMRDALSLLDRIISFAGQEVSLEEVSSILGVADRAWLESLVRAALDGDAAKALGVVQDVFQYGLDLKQFGSDLVHYLRDIIVLQVAGTDGGLTDLADEEMRALHRLGSQGQSDDLERLFHQASRAAERLAHAAFPRLELEMAVIRMCRLRPLRPLDAWLERLSALERHLDTGAPLPPKPKAESSPSTQDAPSSPPPSTEPPVSAGSPGPSTASAPDVTLGTEAPSSGSDPGPIPPLLLTPSGPEGASAVSLATEVVAETVVQTVPDPPPPLVLVPDAPPEDLSDHEAAFDQDAWEAFVGSIRADDPSLAATLDQGQVLGWGQGTLNLAFPSGAYTYDQALESQDRVLALLQGSRPEVTALEITAQGDVDDSPFQRRERRQEAALEARRQELRDHPAVQQVLAHFDGELTGVRLEDQPPEEPTT